MVGEDSDVGGVSVNGGAPAAEPVQREPIPDDVRWDIYLRDGHRCKACGFHRNLVIDHILAVNEGGTNDPTNLQTLCCTCNAKKHTTGWEVFLARSQAYQIETNVRIGDTPIAHLRMQARQIIDGLLTDEGMFPDSPIKEADKYRIDVCFRILKELLT